MGFREFRLPLLFIFLFCFFFWADETYDESVYAWCYDFTFSPFFITPFFTDEEKKCFGHLKRRDVFLGKPRLFFFLFATRLSQWGTAEP